MLKIILQDILNRKSRPHQHRLQSVTSIGPGEHIFITKYSGEDSVGVVLEEDEGSPFEYKKATEMTVRTYFSFKVISDYSIPFQLQCIYSIFLI